MPAPDPKLSAALQYCEYIASGFRHYEAERASGIPWGEFRIMLCRDPELQAHYKEARALHDVAVRADYDDRIEQRALEGWDEPIYQGGYLVGKKRVFSERAMEMLGKALAPERYCERIITKNHVSGPDGGPIPIQMASAPPEPKTMEEWEQVAEQWFERKDKKDGKGKGAAS